MFLGMSWLISLVTPIDEADLFHKAQKVEKLVIKNQIGYHFKRVVREVSQELFISRKIDVSALFLGLEVLKTAQENLMQYCVKISDTTRDYANRQSLIKDLAIKPKLPRFTYNLDASITDFAQAKASCEAKGMRLPEMYSTKDARELNSFMKSINADHCWAGLIPDPHEAVFRFISTGIPIWKGPFDQAVDKTGKHHAIPFVMDDINAKFIYSSGGILGVRWDKPSPVGHPNSKYGDFKFRDTETHISEIVFPVICELKWDGIKPEVREGTVPGTTVDVHRLKRSTTSNSTADPESDADDTTYVGKDQTAEPERDADFDEHTTVTNDESTEPYSDVEDIRIVRALTVQQSTQPESEVDRTRSLREYCYSTVSLAEDTRTEMYDKITKVLSLVDITVHMENNHGLNNHRRRSDDPDSSSEIDERSKRVVPLFMAKFFFSTGFKLIWGLYGIVDKIRTEKRLRKMEKNIAQNSEMIKNLSQIAYGNSLAIEQLNITTRELKYRITNLEHRVEDLTLRVDQTVQILDAAVMISLINSLIERVQQSMNSGYDVLKDVIHCSLLGQTSPLLLPLDQIDLVQNKVRKVSTSILDADFIKMQSVIVSDPSDPHLLLVIINAAALSREPVDLVQLVSIPYYEGDNTFFPILDYQTVVLNQLKRTYSILTQQEEISCLSDRCYVSDVERPVSDKTCGMPQFFDEHMDACIADETTSTGVFLKPMLPDGVLFAFRSPVTSQLFCQRVTAGPSTKLNGTGIMQLPNGCVLSLVDKKGVSTKVKGPPIYRLLNADDFALVVSGPLSSTLSQGDKDGIRKKATYDGMITNHLSSVIQQMKTSDHKLDSQATWIWSLLGMLLFISILVVVTMLLLYRYSTRFRHKVNVLRDKFVEINQQVKELAKAAEDVARRMIHDHALRPPLSPKVTDLLTRAKERIALVEARANPGSWNSPSPIIKGSGCSSPDVKDNTYVSFQPADSTSGGMLTHLYTRLSPTLHRVPTEHELQELNRDSEEVEELTQLISTDSSKPITHNDSG